jgi:hypothetical protein
MGHCWKISIILSQNAMTGIDGCDGGQQLRFPYKTATDIKRFLRNKVHAPR